MNRKILTTSNGKIMEVTLSPYEAMIMREMAAVVSIPEMVKKLNAPHKYAFTDVQAAGNIVRNFYNLLEK